MFAPKNILVPTDFSTYADAALKKAVDIALTHQGKIFLLHVIDQRVHQYAEEYSLDEHIMIQIEEESLKQVEARFQKEVESIAEAKQVEVVYDIQKGNPTEVILQEQKAKGIDLIVIASHGKTGILRHLIGSVADKVVRSATCSVLVVKT